MEINERNSHERTIYPSGTIRPAMYRLRQAPQKGREKMTWQQKIDQGLDAVIHPSRGPKWITIKQYWNKYKVRSPWEEIECSYEDLEKTIEKLKL